MKLFTDRIKKVRKQNKISVEYLAGELNIAVNTYYRWERNESNPNHNDVRILAYILGVDVSFISDVKPVNESSKLLNLKEIEKLFTNKNLPVDIRNELVILDKAYTSIKKENESLKYKNKMYRQIISERVFPEYYKDNQLRFYFCNDKFRMIIGAEKKYFEKKNRDFFSKADAEKLTNIERSVLQTGNPVENIRIILNNINYLLFVTSIKDENGNITNILGNLIDVDYYNKIQQQI